MSAQTALDVADWRRRVFALYERVRENPDAAAAHRDWATGRDALFASHPSTPLLPEHRDGFGGLPVAEYDPAWRFELQLEPTEEQRLEVETGTDGVVPFERIGVVQVPDVGTLDVWRLASYGGGLFLPVKDPSPDTYGGGRYLLDTVKGADLGPGSTPGSIVVDFNFAYNPSCAYDPMWACPLAQTGNTVAVPIPVGERH
ncbi:DUF1684 domain-containing protein [Herbiconiux sp. SYSU D00978]|uniref:DUF1684 domain-containing protein n=1 Tax=Herbiconiux sp. SYSU D00978 TaxID=2812562 RepID=UPI0027DD0E43|nr:DUF1684 domain-containing protein [Herbiconiux sp. SYSU D00978]